MPDPRALYSQAILDHGKRPRNARIPGDATRRAEGHNAVCGDRLVVGVTLDGERLRDLGFEAVGCAICVASASAMTGVMKDSGRDEALDRVRRFLSMVRGDDDATRTDADLVDLAFFREVGRYPVRIGCATLAWTALQEALADDPERPILAGSVDDLCSSGPPPCPDGDRARGHRALPAELEAARPGGR